MRKRLFLLLAIVLFAGMAMATEKLKDLPDDHWAAAAVYDLVKMGITKGYPDGTFRGDKPITRYESALFLSKLAKAIGNEDLKADLQAIRDQIVALKKQPQKAQVTGGYESTWKVGNILATQGSNRAAVASYRLTVSASQELSEDAALKINLDTMDYGYFDDGSAAKAGRGLLASELFDLESKIKLDLGWENPVDLKLTYGPRSKIHAADLSGALPSEIGVTYIRPDTGIAASTNIKGINFHGGFFSRQGNTPDLSGKLNTGWLTGGLGFTLERLLFLKSLYVDLSGDYMASGMLSAGSRNIKGKVSLALPLGEKVQASGTVGLGSATQRMMVAGSLALNDLLDTGTVIAIKAAKVGAEYISPAFAEEQFDFAGYDNFSRPLVNTRLIVFWSTK